MSFLINYLYKNSHTLRKLFCLLFSKSQIFLSGEYRVALPDGRTQIVTYKADHYGGFVADVKYEGTAVYPPAPPGGYGPYKPARA